jgi:hypothetical protein
LLTRDNYVILLKGRGEYRRGGEAPSPKSLPLVERDKKEESKRGEASLINPPPPLLLRRGGLRG